MKKYQLSILSFALGIFAVTSLFILLVNRRDEVVPTPTPRVYTNINVFFSSTAQDPNSLNCDLTYPVQRPVSRLSDNEKSQLGELAYLAISELLKGPTVTEKVQGYFTSINEGTKIQKIIIENEIATADFNEKLDEGVAGSCRVMAIRSQITETLKQLPGIKEVIISVNGESEEILQP